MSDNPQTITTYYLGALASKPITMGMTEQPDSDSIINELHDQFGLVPGTYDLVPFPK